MILWSVAFSMNGSAAITGNSAGGSYGECGGGAFITGGTYSVSGGARITGNTEGTGANAPANNAYLDGSTIVTVAGQLTENASIGVTLLRWDGDAQGYVPAGGVFAEADAGYKNGRLDENGLAHFTPDAAGYVVRLTAGGKAELYKPVTGVTLNKTALTLTYGDSETLTATVSPDDATYQSVTWASDSEGVATVDADGKVTAVSPGTVTITVTTTDGGKTATCTVTVSPKSITPTVTLSATSYSYDGTAKKPTVTVKDGNTTLTSNDYTATYSNNTDPGTATVTVTLKGNYSGTATATFQIYGVKGAWKNGSKLTATVNVAEPANALLIAVVYDKSGKQVSVKVVELAANKTVYETGVTTKTSDYTYKLMVVSKSTYAPLCAAWSE